jgi:hypothetical protein
LISKIDFDTETEKSSIKKSTSLHELEKLIDIEDNNENITKKRSISVKKDNFFDNNIIIKKDENIKEKIEDKEEKEEKEEEMEEEIEEKNYIKKPIYKDINTKYSLTSEGKKTSQFRINYLNWCEKLKFPPAPELLRTLKNCLRMQAPFTRLSICHANVDNVHVEAIINTLQYENSVNEILLNHNVITDEVN